MYMGKICILYQLNPENHFCRLIMKEKGIDIVLSKQELDELIEKLQEAVTLV